MYIRKAIEADASALAALSIEVWINTYIREGIDAHFADYALAEFSTAKFTTALNDPNEVFLASQNSVGIDGYIRLSFNRPAPVPGCHETEISTLYVQPRHQGKGIGAALLEAALKICRERGNRSPWLLVNSENDSALEFYHAKGFMTVGQSYFEIKDQSYRNDVLSL
ncbi:GNAT family N-acetyltransferase [Epibacterium ulvae]|uniref:GNAT family N-acetyltransferase n=1 Tax=Epibacterium ulvae TaxID=1156985 RepID=UPI00248FC816|nr:GNAT family N-acetyltransferase [Epibacterium ulvae]